ncbi:H-NS histone family protein [Cupriavidus pauculus]|uniref:H-NS histone family protein n=1 Tax=Cupriavidus pauculus TaxID=82633 RepID=UPI001EE30833|nr:H-NS histone family protein [Cupriavidus pauculus]GJG98541.1 H-NS histone family protein [Cupriavidus pauculus]
MTTYKQLLAEKAALDEKITALRAQEVSEVTDRIRALMADYGLSVEDLAPKRGRGRPPKPADATLEPKEPLPAKYKDPKSGKSWSGRGRAPAWLGANPKRFLITA